MFEREIKLYEFLLGYCKLLVRDIDESQMSQLACPGSNPPVWLLGHLALCTDFAARLCGERPVLPREWRENFAPGSKPLANTAPYPTKAELLDALSAGHERVAKAAAKVSPEALEVPHSVEILKGTPLVTNGDVLAHLMTTHESMHLGQLSAWRRQVGLPPVLAI